MISGIYGLLSGVDSYFREKLWGSPVKLDLSRAPDDILRALFDRFESPQLRNVSLCNKKFHQIANEPRQWNRMKKELGLNEETDKKIVQIHLFRKYQLKKIENSSEASDYAGQYVVFSTDYLEDDETIPRLGLKWGRFGFVTKNPAITGNLDKNGHHLRVISLKNLEAKHMICNNNYLKSHELFMRLATPEELDIIEAKKTDIQFKFGILIKN